MIGPFLSGKADAKMRKQTAEQELFSMGIIHLSTDSIHTVKPLEVDIPKGRLTVVTGVSGSGKTTMVLESLVPGLQAVTSGRKVTGLCESDSGGRHFSCEAYDATPIGINCSFHSSNLC